MQRSVANYDYSRIVRSDERDDAGDPRPDEFLRFWNGVLIGLLGSAVLLLVGRGIRVAWVAWVAMR